MHTRACPSPCQPHVCAARALCFAQQPPTLFIVTPLSVSRNSVGGSGRRYLSTRHRGASRRRAALGLVRPENKGGSRYRRDQASASDFIHIVGGRPRDAFSTRQPTPIAISTMQHSVINPPEPTLRGRGQGAWTSATKLSRSPHPALRRTYSRSGKRHTESAEPDMT
ncbi:hypothetical protein BC628DRAFT_536517 [Trametes gibbosa]|nr:hypothetical protein BC628DRAFT_536517 [Trametes gibbosa]